MKKATAKAPKLDKATKQAIIDKAVKKALKSATEKAEGKKARKEKEVKAPTAEAKAKQKAKLAKQAEKLSNVTAAVRAKKESKISAYEWAVANIKKPSDAAARKLIVGDVIECFYNDDPKPRVEVVICSADKGEDIYDVLTVPQEKWGTRTANLTKVNTDMWRLIGTMKFNVKK